MLQITIDVRDDRWKARVRSWRKTVQDACEAALKEAFRKQAGARKKKKYELSVVLADDPFIRELNGTYRGKKKPTNVLSFPAASDPRTPASSPFLGDIVLALDTIEREALEQGKALRHHVLHLLVHGTLHLVGYDHERGKDAEIMETLEIKILKKLGVSNPYLS